MKWTFRAWSITALVTAGLSAPAVWAAEVRGGALVREPAVECKVAAEGLPVAGTITAHMVEMRVLVGARWGEGLLTFNDGTKKRFNIFGFNALESGVAAVDIVGEVYNLDHVDDFPGAWYGARGALADFAGPGEAVLNNRHCVIVKARTAGQDGGPLSVPEGGGVEVDWEDD